MDIKSESCVQCFDSGNNECEPIDAVRIVIITKGVAYEAQSGCATSYDVTGRIAEKNRITPERFEQIREFVQTKINEIKEEMWRRENL